MSNARDVRLLKAVALHSTYTDWQIIGVQAGEVPATPGNVTSSINVTPLCDFSAWAPSLRIDENVQDASSTFWRNSGINYRVFLNQSDYAYWSIFVVTLRKDSTNRRPGLPTDPLVKNVDYVESADAASVRLNVAVFKVHAAHYLTLTNSNLQTINPVPGDGNPYATWRKGQINISPKARIRAPVAPGKWSLMNQTTLPYYQRYFLLSFVTCRSIGAIVRPSSMSYDVLSTCINST